MKNSIRKLRKSLGLRQKDVANALCVSRQTINAIENDKHDPTLDVAMKLAKCLGSPVDKLFILDDISTFNDHKE